MSEIITTPTEISINPQFPINKDYLFLEIKNIGTISINKIWIRNTDDFDFSNIDKILEDLTANKRSDEEKIVSIFDFIVKYRYHFEPPTEGDEEHDPLLWLNVYGYGFCDDAAVAAQYLWTKAGFPARVWILSGHMVPEVFFDNAWHHLDPDNNAIYRKSDGTIYSVGELEKDPDVIIDYWKNSNSTLGEKLAELYSSSSDNRCMDQIIGHEGYSPRWTLRPGESFRRWKSRRLGLPVVRQKYNTIPPRYANGEWFFELSAPLITNPGNVLSDNIRAVRDGDAWYATLSINTSAGYMIIPFNSPFVFITGDMHLKGTLANNKQHIRVYLSRDGKEWFTMAHLEGPDSMPLDMSLLSFPFHTYAFYVKIELQDGGQLSSSSPPQVDEFSLHMITQCSPLTFPTIQENVENTWHIDFMLNDKTPQQDVKLHLTVNDNIEASR